jgi:hypothetical protein
MSTQPTEAFNTMESADTQPLNPATPAETSPPPTGAVQPASNASVTVTLLDVEAKVNSHYPRLLPAVKAGLATFGTMALAGRTKPLSLIYEATSGYGKSAIVEMFFPLEVLREYAYRCDKFTPKAFVTHAANVPRERLAEIDLLPKLHGKVSRAE